VHHIYILEQYFSKILKNMRVFFPHSIFILPNCVLRTIPGPLDLYKTYGLIPEMFYFLVQNVYQMLLKSTFFLHLNDPKRI
jgi:hypothetical protein